MCRSIFTQKVGNGFTNIAYRRMDFAGVSEEKRGPHVMRNVFTFSSKRNERQTKSSNLETGRMWVSDGNAIEACHTRAGVAESTWRDICARWPLLRKGSKPPERGVQIAVGAWISCRTLLPLSLSRSTLSSSPSSWKLIINFAEPRGNMALKSSRSLLFVTLLIVMVGSFKLPFCQVKPS